MRRTSEERLWAQLTSVLAERPPAQWECFGLIGRGFPGSLYKLFARCKPHGRWWRFEHGLGLSRFDPVAYQRSLPATARLPDDHVLHGGLPVLAGLRCDPEKPGLVRGLALLQQAAAGPAARP